MRALDAGFLAQEVALPQPARTDTAHRKLRANCGAEDLISNFPILRRKPWNAHPGGEIVELTDCPFNPAHRNGEAAFTIASNGVLGFSCKHNGCKGKTISDIRGLLPLSDCGSSDRVSIRCIEDVPRLDSFGRVEVRYVVEGFLAEGTVNLLSADAGHGKSTLSLALCASIAYNTPFCGRTVLQRPVLYLDRENPLSVVSERLQRLGCADSGSFIIWGGWCRDEAPDPSSWVVKDWVTRVTPKPFIVADSLIAFHPGAENDSAETRRYLNAFRALADTGSTVLLLHHTGKGDGSQDYRGSSDIKAAVDCAFHLKNTSSTGKLERLRVRTFKNRLAPSGDFSIRFLGDAFVADTSLDEMQTAADTLRSLLESRPGVSASQFESLAIASGISRCKARHFLRDGKASGTIAVAGGPNNACFHTWTGGTQK